MIHIGQEHEQHHRVQGHLGRPRPEHAIAALVKIGKGADERPQLLAVRLAADRRQVRRARSRISRSRTPPPSVEHEASTSKIGEDQIFYCQQRGISTEDAVNMIVNGFCKEVFRELPMEFAVEAQKLLGVTPRRQRRLR